VITVVLSNQSVNLSTGTGEADVRWVSGALHYAAKKRLPASLAPPIRWAEALLLERQHGDHAPDIIATHVKELALAGDDAGVQRWIDIADRYVQLQRYATVPH
jgi:hypothetical protein